MRQSVHRLLWFIGLCLASLTVTAAGAYGLRVLVFFILTQ